MRSPNRLTVIYPHLPVIASVCTTPAYRSGRTATAVIPAVTDPQRHRKSVVIRALHDLIELGESGLVIHIPHIPRLKLSPRDHENDTVETIRLDAGKNSPPCYHLLCPSS